MDVIIQFLIEHGLWGMFIAAFFAGSILPLASEVVLSALVAASVAPLELLVVGTIGNTLGSATNYGIGRLGREDMIERYLRVNPQALERGKRYVHKFGFWGGLLSWIPILGSLITIALGYLRVNLPLTVLMLIIGKFVRYCFVVLATQEVQSFL